MNNFQHGVLAYSILFLATMLILAKVLPNVLLFSLTTASSVGEHTSTSSANTPVDLAWHAPATSWPIGNLTSAINGTGVYGFVFNSSTLPAGASYSATYNWCNMPHIRRDEYPRASRDLKLRYVEVIHRHHKRTPYAANTFPVETDTWYCNDSALYYYGSPQGNQVNESAATFWSIFTDTANPLKAPGFAGNCAFPQITREGLDDSWAHGRDLAGVYRDLLHFLPSDPLQGDAVKFRVTNNVITSQVAAMVLSGMFGVKSPSSVPLLIQPSSIDGLEPAYSCPSSTSLFASYSVGSNNLNWTAHLTASASLFSALDRLSGVSPDSSDWHRSWDHYYDNLSARQCHHKALPCNGSLADAPCVSQTQAEEVYRLGQYEYSYIYRAGGPSSLAASASSFGVYIAELAQHLRDVRSGVSKTKYWHNVAHDGSVSRLLSILQIDRMVWPGMGSEVVFELYQKADNSRGVPQYGPSGGDVSHGLDEWFVRVLWSGQVLRSSNPSLGSMDMVPLDTLLAYFDGLVGQKASLVPGKCSS